MTAPSLRAVGTGNAYIGTNSTLDKPAGVVAGDLLLAILCADGPNDPIPWATRIPAGWSIAEEDLATGGTFKTHGAVAYKVAGASEPSTYAFSFGAQAGTGIVVAYQGVNTTTPINVSAKQENGSATTAHPLPSVTTTVGDCLAVAVYQHRGNNGVPYTEPSGWTERVDFKGAASNSNFGVADKAFVSAGATGTTDATGNAADETWVAVIALAPASGGGVAITGNLGTATAAGFAAAIVGAVTIACSLGTASATGKAASISAGGAVTISASIGSANAAGLSATVASSGSAVLTSPVFKNNTGTVLSGLTVPKVAALRLSDMTVAASWTNQVTDGSGNLTLTGSITAATAYLLVTSSADGLTVGVSKVTAV
jgi:hypothetical protein